MNNGITKLFQLVITAAASRKAGALGSSCTLLLFSLSPMPVGTATAVVSCFSLSPEESGETARAASFAVGHIFFSLLPIGLVGSPFHCE
jgi:hypothetical protein